MRKIVKISLILLSIMLMVTKVYAVSCNMELQATKKNDEIVVEVAITNIDTPQGIIAFEAILEYDKSVLSLEGMKGQNSWAEPSYNDKNGKFNMLRSDLINSPEKILQITFKIINPNAQDTKVTLKNVSVSGGTTTGDVAVPTLTKTISIKEQTPVPPGEENNNQDNTDKNPGDNTNNGNSNTTNGNGQQNPNSNESRNIIASTTNNKASDSTKKGILPKAGATNIILFVLGGAIILSTIFYIRMKKIDRKFKN